MFIVYILRTSSDTLYIGQTNDLERRLRDHKSGSFRCAKYLKYFDNFNLVYKEEYYSRQEAMKREYQLKGWTRKKKEALIVGDLGKLKQL
jgi:predicted GIY-YIG superfamily endonuclease